MSAATLTIVVDAITITVLISLGALNRVRKPAP
jgi:hypothetical protein